MNNPNSISKKGVREERGIFEVLGRLSVISTIYWDEKGAEKRAKDVVNGAFILIRTHLSTGIKKKEGFGVHFKRSSNSCLE